MTCMIVDDEPLAVKLLETFVGRTADLELKGSFTDSIEALDVLAREPVDLLFLDIQMPDLNGMELAHAIDTERTRVIFTTAFKDYAFESYEVNALDFLLKPIRYIKFQAAIEKARNYFAMKESAKTTASQPSQPIKYRALSSPVSPAESRAPSSASGNAPASTALSRRISRPHRRPPAGTGSDSSAGAGASSEEIRRYRAAALQPQSEANSSAASMW